MELYLKDITPYIYPPELATLQLSLMDLGNSGKKDPQWDCALPVTHFNLK